MLWLGVVNQRKESSDISFKHLGLKSGRLLSGVCSPVTFTINSSWKGNVTLLNECNVTERGRGRGERQLGSLASAEFSDWPEFKHTPLVHAVICYPIRLGITRVPRDTILSWYFARDNDNITVQRFCNNRYIARNFIHDTSRYLCHWRNSEFIDCTESISQELQNTVNQLHMNDSQIKQSVYCTVDLLNTHTDHNLDII